MSPKTCTCSPDRPCTCDWPDVIGEHEIDRRFVADWTEYGMREIARYLRCHALFTDWLADHGRI